ncbi:MAG: hypothetical protein KDI19_01845 [Pseudomonadales bacterium]|nr:hypothetical protein [Pseudomonadales bacterium]
MPARCLLSVLAVLLPTVALADPGFFLVRFEAAPGYQRDGDGLGLFGIAEHADYVTTLFEKNVVLMGGVLVDESAELALLKASDLETAERLVAADPAVKSGRLSAHVAEWRVERSSMRNSGPPSTQENTGPRSFKLERTPDAPINLKDQ